MKNEILKNVNSIDSISKDKLKHVIILVSKNPELLEELIPLLFQENNRILQKTGLILSELANQKPDYFRPYISNLLSNLYKSPSDATKRNILRVLQYIDIPKKQHDAAVDLCFQYLLNKKEPIAIQVFAMTVLANIVQEYPELKNELLIILEDRMQNGSPGFRSRARKTLQLLT